MENRLFVCGDTHGSPYDTKKLNTKNFPTQKNLTKDDVVVQLGDFGWLWYEDGVNKEQEHWLDWLAEKPFTLAVVPGNHENYNLIDHLPITKKWGNVVKVLCRKTENIYILERGQIYNINGNTVFTCGGALSVDKQQRTKFTDWWPQEEISYFEERRALDALDKVKWKVDYVFTHTCPTSIINELYREDTEGVYSGFKKSADPVAKFLDFIDNRLKFKEWHFGHFHKDQRHIRDDGCIFQSHYLLPPHELPSYQVAELLKS